MKPLWKAKRDINQFVDNVAYSPIRRFYPTSAAKYADVSLELAFKLLMDLTDSGELHLVWELRCPDYSCARTVLVSPEENGFPDEIRCVCGSYFEVQPKYVLPAFEIDEEYRNEIRSKKKKQNQPRLQLSLT
jgi:hypothetical protein